MYNSYGQTRWRFEAVYSQGVGKLCVLDRIIDRFYHRDIRLAGNFCHFFSKFSFNIRKCSTSFYVYEGYIKGVLVAIEQYTNYRYECRP